MRFTKGRAIAAVVLIALGAAACAPKSGTNSASDNVRNNEALVTGQSLDRLHKVQPLHEYPSSQILANLQDVEDIQAYGVQTTSFSVDHAGNLVNECPSYGFPVHATDQLTNPEQVVADHRRDGNGGSVTIPQADPTGIYSGNSSGTYVKCVGPGGKPYYDYWEGDVFAVTGPAHWDAQAQPHVVVDGPSSFSKSINAEKGGTLSTVPDTVKKGN